MRHGPARIAPYRPPHEAQVLALSLRAWAPVFRGMEPALPSYVWRSFYPEGWEARQAADVRAFLLAEGERAWVALEGDAVLGWMGLRVHPEDRMGEVHAIAVDPDRQRRGIGRALLDRAMSEFREAGLAFVMVETGGDPGHAAARAAYERAQFARWEVVRYVRKL